MPSRFKNIFFDFDGVLLDTIEAKGHAFAAIFEKFGGQISQKVYDFHINNGGMNRRHKIQECYTQFLRAAPTEAQLSALLEELPGEMQKALYECLPVKGALDFMKTHHSPGRMSWVVSAAPEEEIKQLCAHFNYAPYLNGIFGFPNKKAEQIKKLMQEHKLNPNECLMIGDAKGDFSAAQENGISFLLRWTPYSKFAQEYQAPKIRDFTEIEEVVSKL